ncbi:flagellar hook-basal body complex protein [Vreelandella rituensis]|uniref:Flagellar hook protein FlgE n=1 Tax=Vreelandella rituensis TaxID=2282306 RepID=A0A368TQW7_9GAMM|nr:flagellar hook-basal body complex protein [Halomonas rituensis]
MKGDGTAPTTNHRLYYIQDDPTTPEVRGLVIDSSTNNVLQTAGGANVEYDGENFVEEGTNTAVDGLSVVDNSQTVFVDNSGGVYSVDASNKLRNESGVAVTVVEDPAAAPLVYREIEYDSNNGSFAMDAISATASTLTIGELNNEYLPAAAAPEVTPGNTDDYTYSTNATVYDSLGNARNLTLYFTKLEASNDATEWSEWKVDSRLSGGPAGAPSYDKTVGTMRFDESGRLMRGADQSLSFNLGDEFEVLDFDMSFAGSTQFANNSTVNDINQNGYTSGSLVGVIIEDDGTVVRNFSNEQSLAAGQIALVSFRNPEGLKPDGDNLWSATGSSGQELVGAPGTGLRGLIEPSAVETSNVDMASELVNMIIAQRAYQANSQTISTQDELLQTIINL